MDAQTSGTVQAVAAVISALVTVSLTIITAWYAALTRRLLHVQIEPSFELELSPLPHGPGLARDVVITNSGTVPIVDIRITADALSVAGGLIVGGSRTGIPWVTGNKKSPWWIQRLNAGDSRTISLVPQAQNALNIAQSRSRLHSEGHLTLDLPRDQEFTPFVRISVRYHREADRKSFHAGLLVMVLKDGAGGDPYLSQPLNEQRIDTSAFDEPH